MTCGPVPTVPWQYLCSYQLANVHWAGHPREKKREKSTQLKTRPCLVFSPSSGMLCWGDPRHDPGLLPSSCSTPQSGQGQYPGILIKTSFQPQWWVFCPLIAERRTVQLAGAPFPSPELGTPAPSTRTVFQSKDTYRVRGERSSPSLGGKKNIFFCLVGVETRLRACCCRAGELRWGRTTSNQVSWLVMRSLQPHVSWGQEDL